MGESDGVLQSSPATPYYHEELYGDPNIVMYKEQMLQLLDSPDSNSMFSSPVEDLKNRKMADVPKLPDIECEEELDKGIAANDLGSLLEQFLEYEEKQVSSRPVSPQSVTKHGEQGDTYQRQEGVEDGIGSGERVFSGKLQDHNYAIPSFVMSKINGSVEEPVAANLSDADAEKMEDGCDSDDKDNQEAKMVCKSQPPSSVENLSQSSNKENMQGEREMKCFDESPECEDKRSQSPCNKSCVELEKNNWKSDTCRRDRELKRRKRSYSSDSDDSDYNDSRDSSRRSSFHKQEKRSRSYGTSSDKESEGECKRYNLRHFERVQTRSKPENHGRNLRSRDRSSRLQRKEVPRNRRGRKEEKLVRPHAYDVEHERKLDFKFNRGTKDTAKEERRIVYIGKISEKTTKDDVWERFRPFGPIEKVSVHIRDEGDNYAFVTYFEPESAVDAIEKGNNNSSEIKLDLCFGGRRKFCGGTYVDFDSNTSKLEKQQELLHEGRAPASVSNDTDFDMLLKMFQKERRR